MDIVYCLKGMERRRNEIVWIDLDGKWMGYGCDCDRHRH